MENDKRLLCIIDSMTPDGAETFIMKLYRSLRDEGYILDFLVYTDKECFYDNEIKKMGGTIYSLPPKSVAPLKVYYGVKKIVKENQYARILKFSKSSLDVLDLIAAKRGGAKIRAVRSMNTQTGSNKLKSFLHKVFRPLQNFYSNIKIAPSTEAAIFMFGQKNTKDGKVHILNNGLNFSLFKFRSEYRNEIRQKYNVEDKFIIGHVGRFSAQKNHMFLLNIFSNICSKNKNARLMLIGQGELESEIKLEALRLGIIDAVIFVGITNQIPKYLMAMDLFLFPSLYEGLPNAVIEAQATGLTCLISDNISREVNISDRLYTLSLKDDANKWSDFCLSLKINQNGRDNQKVIIQNQSYDIDVVKKQFVKIIFK